MNWVNFLLKGGAEYLPVAGNDERIGNYHTLIDDQPETGSHKLICLDPLQFVFSADFKSRSSVNIAYTKNNTKLVSLNLQHSFDVHCKSQTYGIYTLESSDFFKPSTIARMAFASRMYGGKLPSHYWGKAAGYFRPVPVILVSAKCGEFETLFPMDLQLHDQINGIYMLGLRSTNKVCMRLDDPALSITIAEIDFENRDPLYKLGKYHSDAFPGERALPFKYFRSDNGTLVPDFAIGFAECKVHAHKVLGEQVLISLTVHKQSGTACSSTLHHLHRLAVE